jgi:uncharacterized membrane protein
MKKINFKELKPNFDLKKINWPSIRNIRKDALLALFSYLHILVLIPLIFGRKDQFVRYHVKQGLLLLIIWVLASFALYLPYLPWIFLIVIFVDVLFGIIHVILGKERPMPILGKLAEKISI